MTLQCDKLRFLLIWLLIKLSPVSIELHSTVLIIYVEDSDELLLHELPLLPPPCEDAGVAT